MLFLVHPSCIQFAPRDAKVTLGRPPRCPPVISRDPGVPVSRANFARLRLPGTWGPLSGSALCLFKGKALSKLGAV